MKRCWLLVLQIVTPLVGCDQSGSRTSGAPNSPSGASPKSDPMENDWPFNNPEDLAVITLDRIMDGMNPILYVSHDEDDGGWQFLDGGDVTEEDASVVSLRNIVDHDPTIKKLADLPLGWYAIRDSAGKPWRRHANNQ